MSLFFVFRGQLKVGGGYFKLDLQQDGDQERPREKYYSFLLLNHFLTSSGMNK